MADPPSRRIDQIANTTFGFPLSRHICLSLNSSATRSRSVLRSCRSFSRVWRKGASSISVSVFSAANDGLAEYMGESNFV